MTLFCKIVDPLRSVPTQVSSRDIYFLAVLYKKYEGPSKIWAMLDLWIAQFGNLYTADHIALLATGCVLKDSDMIARQAPIVIEHAATPMKSKSTDSVYVQEVIVGWWTTSQACCLPLTA
jgi:hypothetical protein